MKKINITKKYEVLEIENNSNIIIFEYIKDENINSKKIKIGDDSNVFYIYIYDIKSNIDNTYDRELEIGNNSTVNSLNLFLGTNNCHFNLTNILNKKSTLNSNSLFYEKNQNIKVKEDYIFRSTNSGGEFVVNGILDNKSNSEYVSNIIINKDSQKTNTRIDMKLYILDKDSKGIMLPGLDIRANDVKAGHSASTFNLNKEDLFYLNSRGLENKDIKNLIIKSLSENFIKNIEDEEIKNEISNLINERTYDK